MTNLRRSEELNMHERLTRMSKLTKLIVMAPLAIMGIMIFTAIGGEVVMLLWNWLAPTLFGLPHVTFWQALGLLALSRILFGGFGLSGGHRNSRRRMEGRVRERMYERWEKMTPEEREKFRHGLHDRPGRTTPLDSNPSA
jgi:hypothetical protein